MKLVYGMDQVVDPGVLTVIGNTGDDHQPHGLHVSPDLDTVMYTLAGIVNPQTGWGLDNESFNFLSQIDKLGHDAWFQLGDKDLATHIVRTEILSKGQTLTEATKHLCKRYGLRSLIIPATNESVQTEIQTPMGWLPFQEYFVKHQCEPKVLDIAYKGIDDADASEEALRAIHSADLIVIAPSNPIASIGPIIELKNLRRSLENSDALRVCVCPFVAGVSLKGPSDHMIKALGFEASPKGVAEYYDGLIDVLIVDEVDAEYVDSIKSVRVRTAKTVMKSSLDKVNLANALFSIVLDCCKDIEIEKD